MATITALTMAQQMEMAISDFVEMYVHHQRTNLILWLPIRSMLVAFLLDHETLLYSDRPSSNGRLHSTGQPADKVQAERHAPARFIRNGIAVRLVRHRRSTHRARRDRTNNRRSKHSQPHLSSIFSGHCVVRGARSCQFGIRVPHEPVCRPCLSCNSAFLSNGFVHGGYSASKGGWINVFKSWSIFSQRTRTHYDNRVGWGISCLWYR